MQGRLITQHAKYGEPVLYKHEDFLKVMDVIDESWEDHIAEKKGDLNFIDTVIRKEDDSYFEIPLPLLENYLHRVLRPLVHSGDIPDTDAELKMWETMINEAPPEDDYIAVEWW